MPDLIKNQMMEDYADIMLNPNLGVDDEYKAMLQETQHAFPTPWEQFKAWLNTYQYGAVTTRELKRLVEEWEGK